MKSTKDCVIYNKNKKNGVTYVYYGHSDYDSKGICTTKGARKAIGKINQQNEFQPNNTFLLMSPEEQLATGLVTEAYLPKVKVEEIQKEENVEKFYGYPAVIEAAAKRTGVYDSLRKVFPQHYLVIMSIIEQLLCFKERNLYSPTRMHRTCWHTNLDELSQDDITNTLEVCAIDEYQERFFTKMAQLLGPVDSVIALDTTSISTFSAMLHMAKYGYNKEGDKLPQINLLMLCNCESGIPVYYRPLDGNLSDKKAVKASIEDMKAAGIPKRTVLNLDRGFATLENMTYILSAGYSFLMCLSEKSPFYNEVVNEAITTIDNSENYDLFIKRFCYSKKVEVPCPRRGTAKNSYTMSVHVFKDALFATEISEKLTMKFVKELKHLQEEPSLYDQSWYKKHFIKTTNDGIVSFSHNKEAQSLAKFKAGIYVNIAPEDWSSQRVNHIYTRRDTVEKAFENWKDKMRRPRHSIDEHLEGKVFIVYLISIIEASLREKAHDYLLDLNESLEDIIDKFFSAKWRKPANKDFKSGHWIDLTLEEIKLLHIFGVKDMNKLVPNIEDQVQKDLLHRQGRKLKRGRKAKKQPSDSYV